MPNICHQITEDLKKDHRLSSLQTGALYEYLQAERVAERTKKALDKAREAVDALQLQECVVNRARTQAAVKMSKQGVPDEAIREGQDRALPTVSEEADQ